MTRYMFCVASKKETTIHSAKSIKKDITLRVFSNLFPPINCDCKGFLFNMDMLSENLSV